jgi:hypothetical protein
MIHTGVSGILCCAHHDGRRWHGHTYEVRAWWPADGTDAMERHEQLARVLKLYDHRGLGANESSGEQLAELIGHKLDGCDEIEVSRPGERIFARWRRG